MQCHSVMLATLFLAVRLMLVYSPYFDDGIAVDTDDFGACDGQL